MRSGPLYRPPGRRIAATPRHGALRRESRGSMSCREPFVRAVAIADDGRLIFIAAPAAEPEFHGQLYAFERVGGFAQQSRPCEPAAKLGATEPEARCLPARDQVLVLLRRHYEKAQL